MADIKQVLEMAVNLSSAIGSDDPTVIEPALADLHTITECLNGISEEIRVLTEDVARLNDANLALRKSNNEYLRMVNAQREEVEATSKEMTKIAKMSDMI